MPGGQYTNLQFQASQLGLGTQYHELGKVTDDLRGRSDLDDVSTELVRLDVLLLDLDPLGTNNNLSKQDVLDRASQLDFPSSVVEFFQGYLGQPYQGFPEPLRSQIIRDKERVDSRPGLTSQ
jgi:pyruvate carboxylase